MLASIMLTARTAANPALQAIGPVPLSTVRFELYNGRVYLPVLVNGKRSYSLILDSGAAASGLSASVASALDLQLKGKGKIQGNGEASLSFRITKDVSFAAGSAQLAEKTVAVIPFEDIEAHEGRHISGVLGVDFLRRYCVAIRYAEKTLTIYEPATYSPSGNGYVVPLHFKGDAALFTAAIKMPGEKASQAEIAIDSGTYSALRLYGPFVREHQLLHFHPALLPSFGFGVGGEFREELGRVESVSLGGLSVQRPVTSFSQATGGVTAIRAYDGTIGGDILSRFTAIFDYPHARLILEPNAQFTKPFEADGSGLTLGASGEGLDTVHVLHVIENTPARTAGIQEGDIIDTIDGEHAAALGLEKIRALFRRTQAYQLTLRRGGQVVEVSLVTRVLI